jgi:thiol-disulfide isomerase/thioredoxin
MRFLFLLLFFVIGSNSFGTELLVGGPAPDLQAKLLNSIETIQLSQKHGKVVIVNFWATWCGPCKAEMPALQTYLDRHKSKGLEILAISMDEPRDLPVVEKVAQLYTFQVALKSDANFKGLGRIWRMPTTFVVDRNGILRKNGHVGDAEITPAELEALVAPLLAKP